MRRKSNARGVLGEAGKARLPNLLLEEMVEKADKVAKEGSPWGKVLKARTQIK